MLPAWVTYGARFALDGTAYKGISIGSTNRHAPRGMHFDAVVVCEPIADAVWHFPPSGASVGAFQAAVADLFALPHFRAMELTNAMRLA